MTLARIVVTGMGLISPVGNTVEEAWANTKAGKSGITRLMESELKPVAGQVKDFDATAIFGARGVRRTDRVQQFALVATEQALKDSGLVLDDAMKQKIGCIIGTGIGGISTLSDMMKDYFARGPRSVSPVALPQILTDSISAKISIEFGLRGPNYNITTACATGNNAIGDAADIIRLGRAKAMVAGGSEAALIDMVVAGFSNMKAMTDWEGDPTKASRPFDLNRNGFVMSEGAAILVLEDLDHALARGAHIYAELVGYGHTSDAYHVTAPLEDGSGAAQSMRVALADANLAPQQIDYINAHGTSTPLNDRGETLAIKGAFGETAYSIPVSSTKSVTGHLLGAAGAIEAIFSMLAIRDNFAPPTINLETPDPDCDLDYVPNVGREHPINRVLSYSAGFGGHNATLIISRYNDAPSA